MPTETGQTAKPAPALLQPPPEVVTTGGPKPPGAPPVSSPATGAPALSEEAPPVVRPTAPITTPPAPTKPAAPVEAVTPPAPTKPAAPVEAVTPPAPTKPAAPVEAVTPPAAAKAPTPVETETLPAAAKAPTPVETETPPAAAKAPTPVETETLPAAAKAPTPVETETPPARSLQETRSARTNVDSLLNAAQKSPPIADVARRTAMRREFEAALEQTAYPKSKKSELLAAFEDILDPKAPQPTQVKAAVGQDFGPSEAAPSPPQLLRPIAEVESPTSPIASATKSGTGGGTLKTNAPAPKIQATSSGASKPNPLKATERSRTSAVKAAPPPEPKSRRKGSWVGSGAGVRAGRKRVSEPEVEVRRPLKTPQPTGRELTHAELAMVADAQRAAGKLGKPLTRKVRAAADTEDTDLQTSGYSEKRGSGPELTQRVLDVGQEIGHTFAVDSLRDGGMRGRAAASHAEKVAAMANPGRPLAVDKVMCLDCFGFFQRLAESRQITLVVQEPSTKWIFRPDGVRVGVHDGHATVIRKDGSASSGPVP